MFPAPPTLKAASLTFPPPVALHNAVLLPKQGKGVKNLLQRLGYRLMTQRTGRAKKALTANASPTGFGIDDVVEKVSRAAFGQPLVTNVLRGQVAEAIVALALEPEWSWCSGDYSGWDFERKDGLRLEVKQSAARQSWKTAKPSKANFDVAARTGYYDKGTGWIPGTIRPAHIYVFAYHSIYEDHADHRDPSQWDFYVVPTSMLPDVKRIALGTILPLATKASFSELKETVRAAAAAILHESASS